MAQEINGLGLLTNPALINNTSGGGVAAGPQIPKRQTPIKMRLFGLRRSLGLSNRKFKIPKPNRIRIEILSRTRTSAGLLIRLPDLH